MGKIIAITNQKGGVGKTTTAVNLCACLAEQGRKTLLIDADPQGNASSGAGAKAGAQTLYEVLLGTATAEKCIVSTDTPGMDVLPGDIRLAACEVEMVQLERREYRLRAALRPLLDRYDYILIDCPPSLGLLTINALTAANSVLIPIQCEYYALEGVTSLMDTVARIKRGLKASLDIEGVQPSLDACHGIHQARVERFAGYRGRAADHAGRPHQPGIAGGGAGEKALPWQGICYHCAAQCALGRGAQPCAAY